MLSRKFRCDRRKQYLPSMPGRHNTGSAVERLPVIIAGSHFRFARMQPHTDFYLEFTNRLFERTLRGESRMNRIDRFFEYAVHAIACGLDDLSPVRLDRLAQDRIMLRQRLFHGFRMLFPKLCAAFNISKQKRHSSRWQSAHTALISPLKEFDAPSITADLQRNQIVKKLGGLAVHLISVTKL